MIVTLHHPAVLRGRSPFRVHAHDQGLDEATAASGRRPELVIAGQVHNYQRLTRTLPDGTQWPYLVTGAGGYHNLHSIQKVNGKAMIAPVTFETDPDGDPIALETYLDDHHGFLRRCRPAPEPGYPKTESSGDSGVSGHVGGIQAAAAMPCGAAEPPDERGRSRTPAIDGMTARLPRNLAKRNCNPNCNPGNRARPAATL